MRAELSDWADKCASLQSELKLAVSAQNNNSGASEVVDSAAAEALQGRVDDLLAEIQVLRETAASAAGKNKLIIH